MRKPYQKPSSFPSTAQKGLPTPQVTPGALRVHSDPHDVDGTLQHDPPPSRIRLMVSFMNNITRILCDQSVIFQAMLRKILEDLSHGQEYKVVRQRLSRNFKGLIKNSTMVYLSPITLISRIA